MRFFVLLALVVGLLLPTAARAENYSSDQYGFSANFPGSVTVMQPPFPGKGEPNSPIADMNIFMSIQPFAYMAFVAQMDINVPLNTDDLGDSDMDYLRGKLLEGLGADAGEASNGDFQGYRASTFTVSNPAQHMSGKGRMVIVPGSPLRIYIVLGGIADNSSPADIDAVDAFFDSFRLH